MLNVKYQVTVVHEKQIFKGICYIQCVYAGRIEQVVTIHRVL